jgi:hypothetical protein
MMVRKKTMTAARLAGVTYWHHQCLTSLTVEGIKALLMAVGFLAPRHCRGIIARSQGQQG